MENQTTSPIPKVNEKVIQYSFPEAIRELINGRKITRLEWATNSEFGLLKDGWLMIFRNGQYFKWLVNDGDVNATDWILLPEPN